MASTSKKYYGLSSIVQKGVYRVVLTAGMALGSKAYAQGNLYNNLAQSSIQNSSTGETGYANGLTDSDDDPARNAIATGVYSDPPLQNFPHSETNREKMFQLARENPKEFERLVRQWSKNRDSQTYEIRAEDAPADTEEVPARERFEHPEVVSEALSSKLKKVNPLYLDLPSLVTLRTDNRYTLKQKTEGKEVYKDNRQDRTFTYNPFAHRISYTDAEITIPYAEGITHVTNEAGELLFSTRKIGDLERRLELKMQETFVAAADAQFASSAVGCAGNWIVQENRIAYSGIGLIAMPLALLGIRTLRRKSRRK